MLVFFTWSNCICSCYEYTVESLGGGWRMVHRIKHYALFASHAPWVSWYVFVVLGEGQPAYKINPANRGGRRGNCAGQKNQR